MLRLPFVLVALVVAACTSSVVVSPLPTGSPSPSSAPTGAPSPSGQPATAPPTLATPSATAGGPAGGAEIELIITGGQHAGTYRGVANEADACARGGPPTNGEFRVIYVQPSAADGFTSFSLQVRDPAAAEEDETDNFLLAVEIDRPIGRASYVIDPVTGQGGGAVLLESTPGGEATLDVAGQTTDGIDIEASVICNAVVGG